MFLLAVMILLAFKSDLLMLRSLVVSVMQAWPRKVRDLDD